MRKREKLGFPSLMFWKSELKIFQLAHQNMKLFDKTFQQQKNG